MISQVGQSPLTLSEIYNQRRCRMLIDGGGPETCGSRQEGKLNVYV